MAEPTPLPPAPPAPPPDDLREQLDQLGANRVHELAMSEIETYRTKIGGLEEHLDQSRIVQANLQENVSQLTLAVSAAEERVSSAQQDNQALIQQLHEAHAAAEAAQARAAKAERTALRAARRAAATAPSRPRSLVGTLPVSAAAQPAPRAPASRVPVPHTATSVPLAPGSRAVPSSSRAAGPVPLARSSSMPAPDVAPSAVVQVLQPPLHVGPGFGPHALLPSITPAAVGSQEKAAVTAPALDAGKGKKRSPQKYAMLPAEVPDKAKTTKHAFTLFIRRLMGMLEKDAVPQTPEESHVAEFYSHFPTLEHTKAARLPTASDLIPPSEVVLGYIRPPLRGTTTVTEAARIEEHLLDYPRSTAAKHGLRSLHFNFREPEYSVYNSAVRWVECNGFRQLAIAQAFSWLDLDFAYATDMGFLVRLFDHEVCHVMAKIYEREQRDPDGHKFQTNIRAIRMGTSRLRGGRLEFMRNASIPVHTRDLAADLAAISDDEIDTSARAYVIRQKQGRNPLVTVFWRDCDRARRDTSTMLRRAARSRERKRVDPPTPIPSRIKTLPVGVPLDYYSPEYYNSLTMHVRMEITPSNPHIALPLPQYYENPFVWPPPRWVTLPYKQFMSEFGDDVMRQYNIPTAQDYETADEVYDDEGSDGDEAGVLLDVDEDMEDHGDVRAARMQFLE